MDIVALYKKQGKVLSTEKYPDTELTAVKEHHTLNTYFYMDVQKIDSTVVTVNLSHLLSETIIGQCSTWAEVMQHLTEVMVDSYTIEIPNLENPKYAVRAINPLTTDDFTVGYTRIAAPEDRNVRIRRDELPDLVITPKGTEQRIDLNNSLCFINGLVTRPKMFNEEMLVPDGAKFFSSSTELRHPSVVLLDFSELGGIDIVPFSDCQINYRNRLNSPDVNVDLEVILPQSVDLSNSTVFPVIGYSMFFPRHVIPVTKRSLILSPHILHIGTSLLKYAVNVENYLEDSYTFEAQAIEDYLLNTMKSPKHFGAFFVIVKEPSIWVHETSLQKFAGEVDSGLVSDGLLFDRLTQSFFDYTKNEYESITEIYHSPSPLIHEIDTNTQSTKALAMEKVQCHHIEPYLKSTEGGDFAMVKIMKL
jgi:hypothetical protein